MLKNLLTPRRLRGLDLDDPATTRLRVDFIKSKPFLRKLYLDFYAEFQAGARRSPPGPCLEVGSGGGFLAEVMPRTLASDVFFLPFVDLALDAQKLPLADAALSGLFMLNVFHHLPRPLEFLREAERCLRPGGRLVMIEPMNTPWARLIYTRLHHEAFDPRAGWEGPGSRPLSEANSALAWIMFFRDRAQCLARLPGLALARAELHTPLAYLLSGGVSMRSLLPGWCHGPVRGLERLLSPLGPCLGMFVTLELVRV